MASLKEDARNEVKIGDFLVFYVFKPVNGIVAIYKVVSDPFEDHEEIWGRERYPYRVRLEPIHDFVEVIREPIPLYLVLRTFNKKGE